MNFNQKGEQYEKAVTERPDPCPVRLRGQARFDQHGIDCRPGSYPGDLSQTVPNYGLPAAQWNSKVVLSGTSLYTDLPLRNARIPACLSFNMTTHGGVHVRLRASREYLQPKGE
jgi:hypothetical protein